MPETHLVALPEYWKSSVKPRGFTEFCDMVETNGKITGIWEWKQWNPKTGEVVKREWCKNVVTDHGAVNILASAIASASNSSQWNNIYINNNSGSTTLTVATGTGAIATGANLSVAALPAAVPLDYPAPISSTVTQVTLGYGGGTTQTLNINASNSQGATTLNIVGFTPSINYPIGTAIVPLPNVGENPTNTNLKANQSSVVEMYSGNLSSGAFTYSATTGAGNRSVQVSFTFANSTNGGSTPNGAYTDAWLTNVNTGATNTTTGNFVGNYINHVINTPMTVNNSNNITVTITIKL